MSQRSYVASSAVAAMMS